MCKERYFQFKFHSDSFISYFSLPFRFRWIQKKLSHQTPVSLYTTHLNSFTYEADFYFLLFFIFSIFLIFFRLYFLIHLFIYFYFYLHIAMENKRNEKSRNYFAKRFYLICEPLEFNHSQLIIVQTQDSAVFGGI